MNLPENTEVFVEAREYNLRYAIYMRSDQGAVYQYLTGVQMADGEECQLTAPGMTVSGTTAQSLMDNLWQAGIRPTEGRGSAGSLAATEKHLDDMRALAFKAADTELPK